MSIQMSLPVSPIQEMSFEELLNWDDLQYLNELWDRHQKIKDDYTKQICSMIGEQPFATKIDSDGVYYIVSRGTTKGEPPWRTTRFDSFGPSGHESQYTFEESIRYLLELKVKFESIEVREAESLLKK